MKPMSLGLPSSTGRIPWGAYPLTVALLCFFDNDFIGENGENNNHLWMEAFGIATDRWLNNHIIPYYMEIGSV